MKTEHETYWAETRNEGDAVEAAAETRNEADADDARIEAEQAEQENGWRARRLRLQRIRSNNANCYVQDAIRESTRYDRIAELHPGCEQEFQDLYFALLAECGDDCDMSEDIPCEIHDAHSGRRFTIRAWGKTRQDLRRHFVDTSKWRVWLHAEPSWKCDPDHSAAIDGM